MRNEGAWLYNCDNDDCGDNKTTTTIRTTLKSITKTTTKTTTEMTKIMATKTTTQMTKKKSQIKIYRYIVFWFPISRILFRKSP